MRCFLSVFATALLAAAAPTSAAQKPDKPQTQTDPSCSWVWKSGGGVGLWTETCRLKTGDWSVDWNGARKRFELSINTADPTTVVEVFAKGKEEPLGALLPDLKARGYIPDDKECVFQPVGGSGVKTDALGRQLFEIYPIGDRLATLEKTPEDEVPEPPCGEYGWSTHGTRTFRVDPAHPEAVIYVNEGQDGTMIAPDTITFD